MFAYLKDMFKEDEVHFSNYYCVYWTVSGVK